MEKENLIKEDAALNIIERKELEKVINKLKEQGVNEDIIRYLENIPKKNVLDYFIEIDVDWQLREIYGFDDTNIETVLDNVVSEVQANSDDIFNDNYINTIIEKVISTDFDTDKDCED